MKDDIKKTQPLMETLFPQLKRYPVNSMTPSVAEDIDGNITVSMLIIADGNNIKKFRKDNDDGVTTNIYTYSEDNKNGCGHDLGLKLEFCYPTGHPTFEFAISGELGEGQKKFVRALKEVNEFMVWIANKRRKVEKVIIVEWSYDLAKGILEGLL